MIAYIFCQVLLNSANIRQVGGQRVIKRFATDSDWHLNLNLIVIECTLLLLKFWLWFNLLLTWVRDLYPAKITLPSCVANWLFIRKSYFINKLLIIRIVDVKNMRAREFVREKRRMSSKFDFNSELFRKILTTILIEFL